MRARHIAAALVALLLSACDGATEVLLVVDTPRADVQSLRVQAVLPNGDIEVATANLRNRPPPRRLLFAHRGGPLGPLTLEIGGTVGLDTLVSTNRVLRFEPGQRLELHVGLGEGCEPGACPAGLTCGTLGGCRAPEVLACEYASRSCDDDGGALDAQLPDAGPECGAICGVAARHLLGDRVTLRACEGAPSDFTTWFDGTEVSAEVRLEVIGEHTVELRGALTPCTTTRRVRVVEPLVLSAPDAAPDLIQDFAATVEAGFVTANRGVHLIDASGTRPFDVGVLMRSRGWFSVGTYAEGVIVGGIDPAALAFAETAAPFETTRGTLGPVPGFNHTRVHAIAPHPDGLASAAIVTDGGALVARGQSTVDFQEAPAATAGGTWITWGAAQPSDHGEIWFGDRRTLHNWRVAGPPTFIDGNPYDAPTVVGDLRRAVLDSRDGERLWFCGDEGVAQIDLEGQDWTTRTLPAASLVLGGERCEDLVVGRDSDAWVVTQTRLVRFDRQGAMLATHPATGDTHRLALAESGGLRALWVLGADAGRPIVFLADALP